MILFPAPGVTQFTDTTVTVDGLLFGVELDGVAWVYEDLQGWSLGGGVEGEFAGRPGVHGSFDAPVYRRARVIALSGACVADSAALAEEASDALASLVADGRLGQFTVANSRRSLSARVRLSDTPQDEWLGDSAFRWSLQFTAPDFRRYGDAVTADTSLPSAGGGLVFPITNPLDFGEPGSSGRVSVVNDGNAPTEPTLTVTGPLSAGFVVTHLEEGRRLVYPSAVGDAVTVDCSAGTATSGGQDRTGLLSVDEFFTVPPGAAATFAFSTLGTETAASPASLSATLSPAYY